MAQMKEVAADWLVQMHLSRIHHSLIVNGSIKAWITGTLDGLDPEGKDVTEHQLMILVKVTWRWYSDDISLDCNKLTS